jgi:cyanophycinase
MSRTGEKVDMGYVVLQGGAEFGGQMAQSDRRSLALAGGDRARVAILPTAAVPDRNHQRAGENGRRWFSSLGGRRVAVLPLIDSLSAADSEVVKAIRASDLIYLLGGYPGYLVRTLNGSPAWEGIKSAHERGAVVAGSSAGAMVLCEKLFDPYGGQVIRGLGLVPGCCLVPHHDSSGGKWVADLQKGLPGYTIIGIDEQTGMINDGPQHRWNVYGRGAATIYRQESIRTYEPGSPFDMELTTDAPEATACRFSSISDLKRRRTSEIQR